MRWKWLAWKYYYVATMGGEPASWPCYLFRPFAGDGKGSLRSPKVREFALDARILKNFRPRKGRGSGAELRRRKRSCQQGGAVPSMLWCTPLCNTVPTRFFVSLTKPYLRVVQQSNMITYPHFSPFPITCLAFDPIFSLATLNDSLTDLRKLVLSFS